MWGLLNVLYHKMMLILNGRKNRIQDSFICVTIHILV